MGLLDVSNFTELLFLDCSDNELKWLTAYNTPNLMGLFCGENNLGTLDVTQCTNLLLLHCSDNLLVKLNLPTGENSMLREILCSNNRLSDLSEFTNQPFLGLLDITYNNFDFDDEVTFDHLSILKDRDSDFNFSYDPQNELPKKEEPREVIYNEIEVEHLTTFANNDSNLEKLGWDLDDPSSWEGIYWSQASDEDLADLEDSEPEEKRVVRIDLRDLELENIFFIAEFEQLDTINVKGNQLVGFAAAKCPVLKDVWCNNNQIRVVNINENPNLERFFCYDNKIGTLDLSESPLLTSLNAGNNLLTELNLWSNPNLTSVWCDNNQISNISSFKGLKDLFYGDVSNNRIDLRKKEVKVLIEALEKTTRSNGGHFEYEPQFDEDGNKINPNESEPYMVDFGDVNEDGNINIQDAVEILKYVAGLPNNVDNGIMKTPNLPKDQTPMFLAADINSDGVVNMADVIEVLKYVAELPCILEDYYKK